MENSRSEKLMFQYNQEIANIHDKKNPMHPTEKKKRIKHLRALYNNVENRKGLEEDAPTNSMGSSSSVAGQGPVDTFDPVIQFKKKLKKNILSRLKTFQKATSNKKIK